MPNFSSVTISTERLLLRPLEPTDELAMFALRSNEDVNRYTGNIPLVTVESAGALIAKDRQAMRDDLYLRLGMVRLDNDELIGTCGLFNFDAQCRRAEIGYDLRPTMWGQGYMREALLDLLQYAFTTLDLNRVEADVDPQNLSSRKALERLGFQCEGLLRERWILNGVKADTAFYGLLSTDWLTRKNK